MPDVAASLLPYLLTLVQGRKNVPKSQFTHLWKESALRSFDPPPDPPPGATWPTAGPQDRPHLTSSILPRMLVSKNVSACSDGSHRLIRSLEHVQVQLSLSYSRRGDLEISLTSPMGTRSTLVAIRCEIFPRDPVGEWSPA